MEKRFQLCMHVDMEHSYRYSVRHRKNLTENEDEINGSVKFIFQPAEGGPPKR